MAKKRVKRKPKKILIIIVMLIILVALGVAAYLLVFNKEEVKEAKVVSKIDHYGYELKSNKSNKYKKLFKELQEVLSAKDVDEKKYVKKITEMFIVDFYSLGDHISKTDVGGVDFVHPDVLENFIVNAEDTIYKYVESNIYGQRKQELPIIDSITIDSVDSDTYSYGETIDDNAYIVKASWKYSDASSSDYQTSANFIYVHDGDKLQLVEISEPESE